MDCKPDISIVKQENQVIMEDNNENYLDFCYNVRVKVENNDIQTVLAPNNYQDNISFTANDYKNISYGPNENDQWRINDKELKQECPESILFDDVVNNDFSMQNTPNVTYQGQITYEELNEDCLCKCTLCGKYFSNSFLLLQHNLFHLNVPLINRKIFMCDRCPKYYKRKDNLRNHILISHYRSMVCSKSKTLVTKRKHKCLICDRIYSYKTWFSHMTEVHGVRKFKCDECDLSFKGRRYLKRHSILIHQKKDPKIKYLKCPGVKIECPKCPAILDSKYALTTHLRNCHSNERFTCHICNSTLKCKAYLMAHIRRVHHNDGLIHQCDICGKEFKSLRYVKIHIKNCHNQKGES